MEDRLVYKGGNTVINQTGSSLQLINPPRGRSLHRFPRWWNKKPSIVYVDCAIFKVKFENGSVYRLVIPASGQGNILEIRHDGNGNFTFPVSKNIERCALVSELDTTLYVEYQFSKISGGSVLKRTVNSFPKVLRFEQAPEITGELLEGQRIKATPAQYTGGIDIVLSQSILQSKSDTKWVDVHSNKTHSSTTYPLSEKDVDKSFRLLTQVVDSHGMHTSISPEVGPVGSIQPTIDELVEKANRVYVVTVDLNESNDDVYHLDGEAQQPVQLNAGETIAFDLRHPSVSHTDFQIYVDSQKTLKLSVGVEFNNEYFIFTPPIGGTFSYQSSNDRALGGEITVSSLSSEDSQ